MEPKLLLKKFSTVKRRKNEKRGRKGKKRKEKKKKNKMSPLDPNSEFAPASGPRPTAPPGHLHGRLDDLREGGSDAELGFGREVEPWRIQYKDIRSS